MQKLSLNWLFGLVLAAPGLANPIGHAAIWQNGNIIDLGPGNASSVNDSGQVVGITAIPYQGGYGVPFIWHNGVQQSLGLPAGFDSFGGSLLINNLGQVIGTAYRPNPARRGTVLYETFLWDSGAWRALNSPIANPTGFNDAGQFVGGTYPGIANIHTGSLIDLPGVWNSLRINNLGQVAGTNNETRVAYLWTAGQSTRLRTTQVTGINDLSQVTSFDGRESYVFTSGVNRPKQLARLTGSEANHFMWANSIANSGTIVGATGRFGAPFSRAVTWDNQNAPAVALPGLVDGARSWASDVNESGLIVGYAEDSVYTNPILTPEPASFFLLASSLVALIVAHRRKLPVLKKA